MPTPHRTPGRRRSTRSGSPRRTSGFSSVLQLFPLSHAYDAEWVLHNPMGLNALWLTERLCQERVLRPGMRVLDLGCGRALSSILLGREYGVQVRRRIDGSRLPTASAALKRWACPTHADARNLPYAEASSQAVVCADAYTYTGTHDLYLEYLHKYVRPTGQIGVVVPVFMQELRGPLPDHLMPFWAKECRAWHTVDWWRQLWRRTGLVDVQCADSLPDGWRLWLQGRRARHAAGDESPGLASELQVLEADGGQHMGFHRMIAERVR